MILASLDLFNQLRGNRRSMAELTGRNQRNYKPNSSFPKSKTRQRMNTGEAFAGTEVEQEQTN